MEPCPASHPPPPAAADPAPRLNRQQWLLFLLLLAAALLVRHAGLGDAPSVHYPEDEFYYAWTGISLLHGEPPTSWSWLKGYDAQPGTVLGNFSWDSHDFRFVRPALDHPPLFSLLAGGCAMLTNPHRTQVATKEGGRVALWEVDMARLRLLPLALFIATYALLFALAREAFNLPTAYFTLILYGFTAEIILGNRLVVTENLTVPLLLLNLLYLVRHLAGRASGRRLGVVTVLAVAAAVLCKVAAAAQAGVIIVLLLLAGRRRQVIYPLAGLALGLGLYLLYAAGQGWEVFLAVQRSQAGRFSGFNLLLPLLAPKHLMGGEPAMLLIVGWLALFSGLLARRGSAILLAPLVYLAGHLFFASTAEFYYWHYMVYYPFLSLGLAALAGAAWREDDPRAFPLLALLLLPLAFQALYQGGYFSGLLRPLYLAGLCALTAGYFGGPRPRRVTVRLGVVLCLIPALYWEVWPCCLRLIVG